ncbi:phosphotransferase family protein [Microvirga calopogonii]|uniref:phosphotransferase family protein n=1 Tax=Microvirga calopogonii TaxID=2078013 RepID=UPI0013B4212F|nr:phosphotransferase [Microvirga calopogonii]
MIEAGWERSVALVEVPPEEAQRALSGWRSDAAVREVAPLAGGHRHTNLRVVLDDGSAVVVRVCRSGDSCRREASVLGLVRDRAPAPRVLHIAPGGLEGSPHYLVTEFAAGRRLDDVLMHEGRMSATARELGHTVGRSLASVHAVRLAEPGLFDADLAPGPPLEDWSSFILGTLDTGRAEARLGPSLAHRLRRLVLREAGEMRGINLAPRLIHGDFKPTNILVQERGGRWEVSAILDWEFAFSGCPLFDVGTILRYEERFAPGLSDGFYDGYVGGGGELSSDWRRLSRLSDLINLAELANREKDTPIMHRDVRELVAGSVAKLEAA